MIIIIIIICLPMFIFFQSFLPSAYNEKEKVDKKKEGKERKIRKEKKK